MQREAEKVIPRLQKELADTRMERDILKKHKHLILERQEKYVFLKAYQEEFTLRRCLIVSRLASMHFMTGSWVNRHNVSKGKKYCVRK
jgi:hypothetical protein